MTEKSKKKKKEKKRKFEDQKAKVIGNWNSPVSK